MDGGSAGPGQQDQEAERQAARDHERELQRLEVADPQLEHRHADPDQHGDHGEQHRRAVGGLSCFLAGGLVELPDLGQELVEPLGQPVLQVEGGEDLVRA